MGAALSSSQRTSDPLLCCSNLRILGNPPRTYFCLFFPLKNIPSGKNVGLTIDLGLQSILVNELKKGVVDSEAESAHGIIVDPYTGDILAMASIPDFNANRYGDFGVDNYKNRVVSDSYEPGSTYKIVALTAAIEAGGDAPGTGGGDGGSDGGNNEATEEDLDEGLLPFLSPAATIAIVALAGLVSAQRTRRD